MISGSDNCFAIILPKIFGKIVIFVFCSGVKGYKLVSRVTIFGYDNSNDLLLPLFCIPKYICPEMSIEYFKLLKTFFILILEKKASKKTI